MLTPREAFKVGFLARCAEDGVSPADTLDRVKQASAVLDRLLTRGAEKTAFLGELAGGVLNFAKDVGPYAALGLAAAPPVIGGAAGYGLSRALDIDDTDVADVKDRELTEEYRRQTELLNRTRQQRLNAIRSRRPVRALI